MKYSFCIALCISSIGLDSALAAPTGNNIGHYHHGSSSSYASSSRHAISHDPRHTYRRLNPDGDNQAVRSGWTNYDKDGLLDAPAEKQFDFERLINGEDDEKPVPTLPSRKLMQLAPAPAPEDYEGAAVGAEGAPDEREFAEAPVSVPPMLKDVELCTRVAEECCKDQPVQCKCPPGLVEGMNRSAAFEACLNNPDFTEEGSCCCYTWFYFMRQWDRDGRTGTAYDGSYHFKNM